MMGLEEIKKTPLYDAHVGLGAKMTEFGGWWLPLQYTSILEEHKAVREAAGLFDVSHMGEIRIAGPDALGFLQKMLTNDFETLPIGRARYSPMCTKNGTTVDDVLVYRIDETEYVMVVNAANTDKDWQWCIENAPERNMLENRSANTALLALQGPRFLEVLTAAGVEGDLPDKFYSFTNKATIAGISCVVSRTGYTGEAGVEMYCEAEDAARLFGALCEAGRPFGLLPCGLGARDTLRFEAGMPLYGHELSDSITPLEAGLQMFVKMNKEDFIGKEALLEPPKRKRIGIEMLDRGIARAGYAVLSTGGNALGFVTSGMPSPTLNKNLAMALVDISATDEGEVLLEVRGKRLSARVVPLPFYKRS